MICQSYFEPSCVQRCAPQLPGSYVASPSDTMTTDVWNANRDALLSILGTAQIGRKSVSQQAAIDAAKAQYTGAPQTKQIRKSSDHRNYRKTQAQAGQRNHSLTRNLSDINPVYDIIK